MKVEERSGHLTFDGKLKWECWNCFTTRISYIRHINGSHILVCGLCGKRTRVYAVDADDKPVNFVLHSRHQIKSTLTTE